MERPSVETAAVSDKRTMRPAAQYNSFQRRSAIWFRNFVPDAPPQPAPAAAFVIFTLPCNNIRSALTIYLP
jgi:hypothetical protein